MAGPTSRNQAVPRNAASVITDCLFSFCPNSKVVARAVRARAPLKPSHPAGYGVSRFGIFPDNDATIASAALQASRNAALRSPALASPCSTH